MTYRRWHLYPVLLFAILVAASALAAAAEEAPFPKLQLTSPVPVGRPNTCVTHVIRIENPEAEIKRVTPEVVFPGPEWSLVSKLGELRIGAGAEKHVFVSFMVPPRTEAGEYEIVFRLIDSEGRKSSPLTMKLEVAPVRGVEIRPAETLRTEETGQSFDVPVMIHNTGNVEETYTVEVQTGRVAVQNLSHKRLTLKPGQVSKVTLSIKLPAETTEPAYIKLLVQSVEDEDVRDEAIIVAKPIQSRGISGWGLNTAFDTELDYQYVFSSNEDLREDNEHSAEVVSKGTFPSGVRSMLQSSWVDIKSKVPPEVAWGLGYGPMDISVGHNELSLDDMVTLDAEGVAAQLKMNRWEIHWFNGVTSEARLSGLKYQLRTDAQDLSVSWGEGESAFGPEGSFSLLTGEFEASLGERARGRVTYGRAKVHESVSESDPYYLGAALLYEKPGLYWSVDHATVASGYPQVEEPYTQVRGAVQHQVGRDGMLGVSASRTIYSPEGENSNRTLSYGCEFYSLLPEGMSYRLGAKRIESSTLNDSGLKSSELSLEGGFARRWGQWTLFGSSRWSRFSETESQKDRYTWRNSLKAYYNADPYSFWGLTSWDMANILTGAIMGIEEFGLGFGYDFTPRLTGKLDWYHYLSEPHNEGAVVLSAVYQLLERGYVEASITREYRNETGWNTRYHIGLTTRFDTPIPGSKSKGGIQGTVRAAGAVGETAVKSPVSGVMLVVKDSRGFEKGRVISNADGDFVFPPLEPGEYEVVIESLPEGYILDSAEKSSYRAKVQPGLVEDIEIELLKGASLVVSVFDDENENGSCEPGEHGIAGVQVVIWPTDGDPIEAITGSNGLQSLALLAGTYNVELVESSLPEQYRLVGENMARIELKEKTVRVDIPCRYVQKKVITTFSDQD